METGGCAGFVKTGAPAGREAPPPGAGPAPPGVGTYPLARGR